MAEVLAKNRRIVVAVDESEESMYALSWSLKNIVSQYTENTLILLYVKPPLPVYSALDGAGYFFSADFIAAMEKYGNDFADSVMRRADVICRDYSHITKIEKKVRSGDARDVICEAVERLGADMLVMGCHGYGFIKRAFLGSVSDHCSKNVRCPVLIVKHPKH